MGIAYTPDPTILMFSEARWDFSALHVQQGQAFDKFLLFLYFFYFFLVSPSPS